MKKSEKLPFYQQLYTEILNQHIWILSDIFPIVYLLKI